MIQIAFPSKTFLLGEYLALLGEPCLMITSEPYFEFTAKAQSTILRCSQDGIPPHSPTYRFILDHCDFFQDYQLSFHDPHQGAGGLGASSAQFLSAYLLRYHTGVFTPEKIDRQDLLATYIQYAWNGQGEPPSGADLIAQVYGRNTDLIYFDKNNNQVETLNWPFEDCDYFLIRTGYKIPTHNHLRDLNKSQISNLPNLAKNAKACLQEKNHQGLIECLDLFTDGLGKNGLISTHTQALSIQINREKGVIFSKGCGALGADVIVVLVHAEQSNALREWFHDQPLDIIADSMR